MNRHCPHESDDESDIGEEDKRLPGQQRKALLQGEGGSMAQGRDAQVQGTTSARLRGWAELEPDGRRVCAGAPSVLLGTSSLDLFAAGTPEGLNSKV